MAIFFNFSHTSNHFHLLQVENSGVKGLGSPRLEGDMCNMWDMRQNQAWIIKECTIVINLVINRWILKKSYLHKIRDAYYMTANFSSPGDVEMVHRRINSQWEDNDQIRWTGHMYTCFITAKRPAYLRIWGKKMAVTSTEQIRDLAVAGCIEGPTLERIVLRVFGTGKS